MYHRIWYGVRSHVSSVELQCEEAQHQERQNNRVDPFQRLAILHLKPKATTLLATSPVLLLLRPLKRRHGPMAVPIARGARDIDETRLLVGEIPVRHGRRSLARVMHELLDDQSQTSKISAAAYPVYMMPSQRTFLLQKPAHAQGRHEADSAAI